MISPCVYSITLKVLLDRHNPKHAARIEVLLIEITRQTK
jgi:hypothetical protein